MRVPDHSVRIDDDIVRLDFFAGKIVFGDDDLGCPSARAWKALELERMFRSFAQIDAGEVVGEFLLCAGGHRRATGGAHKPLRLQHPCPPAITSPARAHLSESARALS